LFLKRKILFEYSLSSMSSVSTPFFVNEKILFDFSLSIRTMSPISTPFCLLENQILVNTSRMTPTTPTSLSLLKNKIFLVYFTVTRSAPGPRRPHVDIITV
jgi:hypothetical protein